MQGTLGAWRVDNVDDVSASYLAPINPSVGGQPYALYLTFDRYGDATYMGVYPIEGTRDDNRSTCAHCVMAFTGLARDRGFFAASGTVTLRSEPFDYHLDAVLDDLRLVEVTIGGATLESTPIPGGRCLEIAHAEVNERLVPPGWTCPAARYSDGTRCDCECGLFDPDCDGTRAPADCAAGELCEPDRQGPIGTTFCAAPCERATSTECVRAVCAVDAEQREYCDPTPMLRANAAVGDACPASAFYCAPVGASFFDGICDVFTRNDGVCRARCETDATCDTAALEHCVHLFGDTGIGLCVPRYPVEWTCPGASYEDGTYCDCDCGTHDPDCDLGTSTLRGCAAGETCTASDQCASVPANDTCAGALPLTVGTSAAPARTSGTTLGAADDYATQAGTGSCLDVTEDGPDVAYTVTLAAGRTLDVVLTSSSNLSLYLLGPDPSACDATASRCVAGVEAAGAAEPETLHATVTSAGTYYLVIDSFGASFQGDFTLDVSATP